MTMLADMIVSPAIQRERAKARRMGSLFRQAQKPVVQAAAPAPVPEIIKYALGYNMASGIWGIVMPLLTPVQAPLRKVPTILEVIQHVGGYYGVPWHDMTSSRRFTVACHARQIAMYVAYKVTNTSTITIARQFGGRDHSTCIHAMKKIERLLKAEDQDQLRQEVAKFERELAAG